MQIKPALWDRGRGRKIILICLLLAVIAVVVVAVVAIYHIYDRAEKHPFATLRNADVARVCICYGAYPNYELDVSDARIFLSYLKETVIYEKLDRVGVDGGCAEFYMELQSGKRYHLEVFSANPSVFVINRTVYRAENQPCWDLVDFYSPYPAVLRAWAQEGGMAK